MRLTRMGRFNMFRNRLIPKILRCYTFRRPITLYSVKKLVIIMSITAIKCINRYGCGLFNSWCGMEITFFAYVLDYLC